MGGSGAIGVLLEDPTYELIPLANVLAETAALPAGAAVSVTASTSRGLDATLELAAQLSSAGYRTTPHLAARMVRDRAHLRDALDRLDDAGITRAFVVGGDAIDAGEFPDGLSLLRAMAELGRLPGEVGVPGYPDGHPAIDGERLLEALREKAPYCTFVTTQLCFDAGLIVGWIRGRRADGLGLGIRIGVPGVVEPRRLVAIGTRIGVRDTRRFAAANRPLLGRLVRSGGRYRPTELVSELARVLNPEQDGIAGLHLYTFNAVRALVGWRSDMLARTDPGTSVRHSQP